MEQVIAQVEVHARRAWAKENIPFLRAGTRLAGVILVLLAALPGHASNIAMAPRAFEFPEQAGAALARAWHDDSKAELLALFGPAGLRLLDSGDPVADANAHARLAEAYDASSRIVEMDGQKAQLLLGEDDYPYPIPIVKTAELWHFDIRAGEQEIIDRRIGRNEFNAIRVCRTYVEAQRDYAAQAPGNTVHAYAAKAVSSAGKFDGLYWPATEGGPQSPLGPLFAEASAEGYAATSKAAHAPYHGYLYRILTEQGREAQGGAFDYVVQGRLVKGFALVAYPARYGDSGIMTFIVNQHGIVFEKNLGPDSVELAKHMRAYNPDRSWKPVAPN